MKKILFLFSFLFALNLYAQQDLKWLKIKKYKVATLSDSLKETSGLTFFRDKLYTINDGGNSSEVFEIDKSSGKILDVIKTDLKNKDWEAITSDSTNTYIGDFGNNVGTRKDLKIYKIPFKDSVKIDSIQEIPFFYPEQKDFEPKNINNDFDAEAMIFLNGKIHLFTKEWISKSVTHYTVNPNVFVQQPAEKIESFKTDFVVTDASYFDKKLYLIGYTKNTEVFLSVFDETEPGVFFKEQPRKYYLGSSLVIGQIEGIAVDESGIYISGEEFRTPLGTAKQAFYFVPADKVR